MLDRLRLDGFLLALVGCVVLASVLPVSGPVATSFGVATTLAIGLLFFLHGARLSPSTVVAGASHWRLHLVILASTFVLFPVLGVVASRVAEPLLGAALASGILFLTVLPSTVQSSIAFASIAGGNVPAAVCAASGSNIAGMVLTPALVALLFTRTSGPTGFDPHILVGIMEQLLLPFLVGQIAQRWIGDWIRRNKRWLGFVDRGSILMVVYGAFSEAVVNGIWHQVPASALAGMVVVDGVLLAIVLLATTYGARWLGFSRADEITIVFCGSKKSLASGVPMASVIFAGQPIGVLVLPVMLFHQIQLMACAALARRYAGHLEAAARDVTTVPPPESVPAD